MPALPNNPEARVPRPLWPTFTWPQSDPPQPRRNETARQHQARSLRQLGYTPADLALWADRDWHTWASWYCNHTQSFSADSYAAIADELAWQRAVPAP